MNQTTLARLSGAHSLRLDFGIRIHLSLAEKAALTFFTYISIAAVALSLTVRELATILILNAVTSAALLALRRNRERGPWVDFAADMFPVLLILVAYRESGLLLTPDPAHHLDYIFIQWDRDLLHNSFVQALLQAGAPGLQHYLEFAYLLCYPLVPLGMAAVYFAGPRTASRSLAAARAHRIIAMDDFWATVLIATLFCYAVYPFFPLTPPRVLFNDVPGPHVAALVRHWNFWLLDHYSVQACIFPSGHVAAATAVALAVRKHAPRLGIPFMFLAVSMAFATVYGRYHYAADALAGMVVGLAAYKLSELLQ